jgi:hypothetical protein
MALAGLAFAGSAAVGHISRWHQRWIDVGLVAGLVGAALLLWALVLFLAHRHAAQHWCPDPDAHKIRPTVPSDQGAPDGEPHLRSALRQLRSEARAAILRLETAIRTDRYWGVTAGPLPDAGWKKNGKNLSDKPGMTDLVDHCEDAYGHVKRINGFHFLRALQGRVVRPEDDLEGALSALRGAAEEIDKQLAGLDGVAWRARPSQRLDILRAVWGCGGERDRIVTERIRASIADGWLRIRADNVTLGGDPCPGTPKILTIEYQLDGDESITDTFAEDSEVNLPPPTVRLPS